MMLPDEFPHSSQRKGGSRNVTSARLHETVRCDPVSPIRLVLAVDEGEATGPAGASMTLAHQELLKEFQEFSKSSPTAESVMQLINQRLHEKMTRYNWVGFYLVDPADPGILLVGPFVGKLYAERAHSAQSRTLWRRSQRREDGCGPGCLERSALSRRIEHGEVGNCGAHLCEGQARGRTGY